MVQDNYGTDIARFSVGGVISASVSIVLRNVLQLLAISFLLSIPTIALSVFLITTLPVGITALQSGVRMDMSQVSGGTKALFALVFILGFLTYFAIQAAVNYAAFQNLRGERVGIGACIARGLAAMPRLVVACIMLLLFTIPIMFVASIVIIVVLAGLGIAAGSAWPGTAGGFAVSALLIALFFALFFFLYVIWWVFVPAIVAENAGAVGCFGRSRRLTKGHRWGVLGIILLVLLANILASLIVQLLARVGAPMAASFVNIVVSLFFAALQSVLSAVGYYFLRAEKEGFGLGDIARVFD